MSFRPAGMSDASSDEESFDKLNDFPLPKNDNQVQHYETMNNSQEEQDFQFDVVNACMSGQIDVIDEYINSGGGVNEFLFTGWSPLLYASSAALPGVIEHLLKLGADANKHKDGFTPLMAVCNSYNGTPEQCLDCISMLIEAKADPDATNKDRMTPLMYACKSRGPEVVEGLLKYVKNIEACDTDGRSAIFYAVNANKPENLKVLMKHKVSTTTVDRRRLTIRDIAITKNYEKILQLLNFEDEEIENFCPVARIMQWNEVFANMNVTDPECIDEEIANILFALCLDKYRQNFAGMNLKTFLQLTEKDLINLGIDIEFHRKKFMLGLLKFHSAKWKSASLKIPDKSASYTLFDGIVSLANIARQISVIGSSFKYIQHNIVQSDGVKLALTETDRAAYKKELIETENVLHLLKKDFQRLLKYSQKVEKTSKCDSPAAHIGPSEPKKKTNWTVILTVTLMTGIYLSKNLCMQKLWN